MIAKAKAIAHGGRAIEYAMRESKNSDLVASNHIQNNTADKIYQEFLETQKYNTQCKNKFIRIEIGIAKEDEKKLDQGAKLEDLCHEFSKRFGFENTQWIACTHRDTNHLHIHMIANRIGIDQAVYDTSFISNKAGKIAENISREMGLTIANTVERKDKKKPQKTSLERIMAKTRIQNKANNIMVKSPRTFEEFCKEMKKEGVQVVEAKNKKGNTYGLRFSAYNQTFKASDIGEEFGYRTLLESFEDEHIEQGIQPSIEHQQTQQYSAGNILFGIGSILSNAINGAGQTAGDSEEQNNKETRKRKHGR